MYTSFTGDRTYRVQKTDFLFVADGETLSAKDGVNDIYRLMYIESGDSAEIWKA